MAGSGKAHLRPEEQPVLVVEDLVVEFPVGRGQIVHAVSGISFDVLEGETLGLVGESGCGKSTTGRAVMHLPAPTSGKVVLEGVDLGSLSADALRSTRTRLQMIFQDSISSLNPRRKVHDIVERGLKIWDIGSSSEKAAKVSEVLEAVGLDPQVVGSRRPSQFSGGQCQRICIARSLVLDPKVVICDEPVSALDVSVQAQILNLLEDMKERYGLTLVFISHDLSVVKNISDRVIVMYLGKVCEVAPPDVLYGSPAHHYTDLLIGSIPHPDPNQRDSAPLDAEAEELGAIELPSAVSPPSGCRFRTRCPAAQASCADEEPQLRAIGPDHYVACHYPRTGVADAVSYA